MKAHQLKRESNIDVFRRFQVRRFLYNLESAPSIGSYETGWTDLSDYVKRWGVIRSSIDDVQFSNFQQPGLSMVVDNSSGIFNRPENKGSFWASSISAATQHSHERTLIRIQAGFIDPSDTSDIPSGTTISDSPTQFVGIIKEPIQTSDSGEATIHVRSLMTILEETPASKISLATYTGTAYPSQIMVRMRDATSGTNDYIFDDFISTNAWNIDQGDSANTMTGFNTTTEFSDFNCWSLAKKFAEINNYLLYIDRIGSLNFTRRTMRFSSTASVVYNSSTMVFTGHPFHSSPQIKQDSADPVAPIERYFGHTIKKLTKFEIAMDRVYNTVKYKYIDADTNTSYITKEKALDINDPLSRNVFSARTLNIENPWVNTATADNVASTLLADVSTITDRVTLNCRFFPILNLLDLAEIHYWPQTEGGSRWDSAFFDRDNFSSEQNQSFDFEGNLYYITALEHNLDTLESNVTLLLKGNK